ncbi:hypothetical protein BKA63DRAFT_190242 [Paraphoma chrysanthemicola]|nr:hypothetical protein BKA63DRAFT_190242 [Paraphoma chrysanthemicola]
MADRWSRATGADQRAKPSFKSRDRPSTVLHLPRHDTSINTSTPHDVNQQQHRDSIRPTTSPRLYTADNLTPRSRPRSHCAARSLLLARPLPPPIAATVHHPCDRTRPLARGLTVSTGFQPWFWPLQTHIVHGRQPWFWSSRVIGVSLLQRRWCGIGGGERRTGWRMSSQCLAFPSQSRGCSLRAMQAKPGCGGLPSLPSAECRNGACCGM